MSMSSKSVQLFKSIKEVVAKSNGFDNILKKVEFVSGGNGSCLAELKVSQEHLNSFGGLHGGFIATLVDTISSYALMANEKNPYPGVSVDIHVSYLKGAREGDDILIDAKTVKAGKNLAFLEVEIRKKDTNEVLARGSHTKFVGQANF